MFHRYCRFFVVVFMGGCQHASLAHDSVTPSSSGGSSGGGSSGTTPATVACGLSCGANEICCDNTCVDATLGGNCGACGTTCSGATPVCDNNAGGCGECNVDADCVGFAACGATGCTCADHLCAATPVVGPPPACNGGPACVTGEVCCPVMGCVDTTSDPLNCNGCGLPCAEAQVCLASACQSSNTCNGGPTCGEALTCCPDGCIDMSSNSANCGGCDMPCPPNNSCAGGHCTAEATCGGGPVCHPDETCCEDIICANLFADANNCGHCGTMCSATTSCIDGACVPSEGAFNPSVNPTYLAPGAHSFTTIDIPAGVTVFVAGDGPASGALDLHASGAIVISGTIDVSGGAGTQSLATSASTGNGKAGNGGYTGEPYFSTPASAACEFVAGNAGLLGFARQGTAGTCPVASTSVCIAPSDPTAFLFTAPIAAYGGGAGVFSGGRAYGSGGGGIAGGAPGALGAVYLGEADCSGVSAGGGAVNGRGGVAIGAPYDGTAGVAGMTQCPGLGGTSPSYVGGGGGGSIGKAAASDLAVFATFYPGSGGGGGSEDHNNRPGVGGTSGAGAGGGALKLLSLVSISVDGQLLANGGAGADASLGSGANAQCNPEPGAAGGGGSGGVIYLSSPSIDVSATAVLSANGGKGGTASKYATGGGGGNGGLGRLRLSTTPASCSLLGSFNPPLSAGCTPQAPASGFAYVGVYPN